MKISKIILILVIIFLSLNTFAQNNNNDSLNVNNLEQFGSANFNEQIFNLRTEVSTQKVQRNIFVVSFIFMIFVVIMILYLYHTKIKEVLKMVKIQERELELRKFEVNKLGQILNYTENSIILTDLNGEILWANNGFSSLFGKTYQELKAQNNANIFTNINSKNTKVVDECRTTKEPVLYSSDFTDEFDNKVWFQRHLIPILDENKEILNFAVIDSDLTAIKIAMEQVSIQKKKVEDQKQKITDSINYASYIQTAVLPPVEFMNQIIPQHFVVFKPRDIVSGDFYWAKKIESTIFIVAADCTGHGVPGAFMSMLGFSFLNEIVRTEQIKANEILNKLKAKVIASLHQTGKEGEQKDGMDISLCILDTSNNIFQYSGANNDAYFVRKIEQEYKLEVLKANKMPIGIYYKAEESFTNYEFEIKKDDCFYIFSDGYVDQFGGNAGRKFLSKYFKELIINIQDKTMNEQKNIVQNKIEEWMSFRNSNGHKFEQIDDILVMGVKY